MRFAPPTGRESHFPERKTTLRVTITTARSNFRLVRAFQWGEGGRPFSFEPRRVRDEAIFRIVREWKRDSCSLCPSKKFTYVCGMDRTTGKGDLFPFFSFGRGRRTFLIFDNLILLGLKFSKSSGKFPSRKKTRPSNLTQTRRFSNRRTNGNE